MEIKRICNKCGCINKLDSETTMHKDCWTEDGDYIRLTYYKCKQCGEVIPLQLDNQETINTLGEYKKLFKDALMKRIKKQTVGKKAQRKSEKLTKQLRSKRAILQDIYNGKKLLDENKNIFINALTFPKVGDIINGEM